MLQFMRTKLLKSWFNRRIPERREFTFTAQKKGQADGFPGSGMTVT